MSTLNCLLRKEKQRVWYTKEEASFQELKDDLCKEIVFVHFDPILHLHVSISCDMSNIVIGVVMCHHHPEDSEHPFAKFSQMLNPTQCHYNQVLKEAIVVIFRIRKFC